jgi:AP-2 complex subunit beta-1
LDDLDEPEAKASMIWIIGQYADRIENADQLLDDFLYTFLEEPYEVQLALLTATVKLFVQRPTVGQELVPKVLKWATEEVDNPDLRDRGYIYWRLLSTDPAAAKAVVLSDKPAITTESDNLDPNFLDELLLHIGSLASIYHKSPTAFINRYKPRYLLPSPALQSRNDNYTLSQQQQQQQPQQPIIQQEQQYQQQQLQQQDSMTAQFNDWSYNAATSNNRVVSTQSNNPYSTDLLQ